MFELASTELLAHFIPQYSYFYSSDSALLVSQEVEEGEARKEGEKNRRKRKKLESKTSKQVQSLFTLHPSHIIYILEMCLRHVHRLTPLQKNAFNQHSFSLYSRYVSCVIDFASDVDIVNHPVFMDRFLLPALRLHLKIIEVDSFYWENLNKLEVVQKVWNISSSLSMVKSLQVKDPKVLNTIFRDTHTTKHSF